MNETLSILAYLRAVPLLPPLGARCCCGGDSGSSSVVMRLCPMEFLTRGVGEEEVGAKG